MIRRVAALIGILALATTIVPNMPGGAPAALDCCNGIMCPYHAEHAANCDTHGSESTLKPCPVQASVHYMATFVFVLLAPAVLHQEVLSEPSIAFAPSLYSDIGPSIDSPPPRLLLIA